MNSQNQATTESKQRHHRAVSDPEQMGIKFEEAENGLELRAQNQIKLDIDLPSEMLRSNANDKKNERRRKFSYITQKRYVDGKQVSTMPPPDELLEY